MASEAVGEEGYVEPKRMPGQWRIIIGHTLLATVPMILLAVVMLCIVIPNNMPLKNMSGYPSRSYFFLRKISVRELLCLTTLASIFSLLIIPSMLTLSKFMHACDILRMTDSQQFSTLPTTFEFALLLRVLYASPAAFLRALKRVFQKPFSEHHVLRRAMCLSFCMAALRFVLGSLLSLEITD
jgi:hypothetical protein